MLEREPQNRLQQGRGGETVADAQLHLAALLVLAGDEAASQPMAEFGLVLELAMPSRGLDDDASEDNSRGNNNGDDEQQVAAIWLPRRAAK